jgi:hypothetical protein
VQASAESQSAIFKSLFNRSAASVAMYEEDSDCLSSMTYTLGDLVESAAIHAKYFHRLIRNLRKSTLTKCSKIFYQTRK